MERRGLFGAFGIAVFIAGVGAFFGYVIQRSNGLSVSIPWGEAPSLLFLSFAGVGLILCVVISYRLAAVESQKHSLHRFMANGNQLFNEAEKLVRPMDSLSVAELPPEDPAVALQKEVDDWGDKVRDWLTLKLPYYVAVFDNSAGMTNMLLMAGNGAARRAQIEMDVRRGRLKDILTDL